MIICNQNKTNQNKTNKSIHYYYKNKTTMKKTSILIAAIVMMAILATNVMAQSTSSNGAFAQIKTAITLTSTATLEFGAMTSPTGPGTVVLSPAGVPTVTNMVLIGTRHAAAYAVAGVADATYTITLPASTTLVDPVGGGTMLVDNFTSSKAIGTLTGGVDAFNVGATLHIADAQPLGDYAGTYDVTVDYN